MEMYQHKFERIWQHLTYVAAQQEGGNQDDLCFILLEFSHYH